MGIDTSYYDVLGVSRDAATIKKAYRREVLKNHPDKNKDKGATERTKLINLAYETLSDPQKKRLYDNPDIGHVNCDYNDVVICLGVTVRYNRTKWTLGPRPQRPGEPDRGGIFKASSTTKADKVLTGTDHRFNLTGEQYRDGTTLKLLFTRRVVCVECRGRGLDAMLKKCTICRGQKLPDVLSSVFVRLKSGYLINPETVFRGRGHEEAGAEGSRGDVIVVLKIRSEYEKRLESATAYRSPPVGACSSDAESDSDSD